MVSSKVYHRDIGSRDGFILTRSAGDIGDTQTRYTYIDLLRDGYNLITCQYIITATTLTIEACNGQMQAESNADNPTYQSFATSTDGTGATIVDTGLGALFPNDDDAIGLQVRIVKDDTTAANVGLTREVVDYAQATGTLTFDTAFGATTSGVTEYKLEDNPSKWKRLVSDPHNGLWTDVTNALAGSSTLTTSGMFIVDTPTAIERIRIKQVTTNATNILRLHVSRGRT